MLARGSVGNTLMKWRAAAIAALLCTIFAGSNADARGPYGSISIGNWQGGAYTNDQTGSFSHCAAGARYASGVYFMVTIDGNGGGGLGVIDEQLTVPPRNDLPPTPNFPRQPPITIHCVPISRQQGPPPHAANFTPLS